MSPAVIAIGLTLVVLALGAVVFALTDGAPARVGAQRALGLPVPWLLLAAILLVLGIVVTPRLLGFAFLFLPMIWSRRSRGPRGSARPGGPLDERERDPHDEDR